MRKWIVCTTAAFMLALASVVPASAQQQTGRVIGLVVDAETGQPLVGAQVNVEGTTIGMLANNDGRFLLQNVPTGDHTIHVERIGYAIGNQTVTVTEGGTATANFQLQPQAVQLEGMVVTGYGSQRREDITGSVASVKADQFVQAPARDAATLIAGKIAGLTVNSPSGDPTATSEIMLRGITTVEGSKSPLVLVDGVPGDLNTVAPQDIESIDVLKDGSAAAVYGSRASNGVIFITTRKYKGGAPTIRYQGYTSYQQLYRQPDFLNAADYRSLISQGYPLQDYGYNTDWQSLMLRQPMSTTHDVTLTGGAANTSYTASLNYDDRQGIMLKSQDKILTGRVHITHSMYDGRLQVDANLVDRIENNPSPSRGIYNYAWRQTLIRNPTDRIYDDSGNWQERGVYFYLNPLGYIKERSDETQNHNMRLHGTVTLRPIPTLSLQLLGGTQRGDNSDSYSTTFNNFEQVSAGRPGNAGKSLGNSIYNILQLTGTYSNNIFGGDATLLGGYSYEDFTYEGFNANNYGFPTDLFSYNDLGSGLALPNGQAGMGSYKNGHTIIAFFGRVNYDWHNRFLLMGSLRYEGNTRFGAAHKWGSFPAVSAGWRLSEESFIKDNASWINDLKVRVGYGITGIAPNNDYLSLASYSYSNSKFLYDGSWVPILRPARNANPDLKWERKGELNVGLDFSLFEYRLAGSIDVYNRTTKDMLYNYDVPTPPFLTGSILANVGTMKNNGIEAELTYDVVRQANFRWQTSINGSHNTNKLASLSNQQYATSDCFFSGYTGEPVQESTHRVCVGGPIGDFYGYKVVDVDASGAWIVQDSAGNKIAWADHSGTDKSILGNGIPKYHLAWNNSVRWGSWDMSTSMRGAFKFQILNFDRMFYENPSNLNAGYNALHSAFDPVFGKALLDADLAYTSYYIENGDYWKIDNVTLGYTLPVSDMPMLAKAVTSARIYFSGHNLWTITGYKGLDPEVPILSAASGAPARMAAGCSRPATTRGTSTRRPARSRSA